MGKAQADHYRLEPLGKQHDRAGFHCAVESLDVYLKTQASQDMRRKANAVFVLVPVEEPSGFPVTSPFALTGWLQEPFPSRCGS